MKYRLENNEEKKVRRKQIIEENGAKVDELGLTYPVKNSDDEKFIFQNAIKRRWKSWHHIENKVLRKWDYLYFMMNHRFP